MVTNTNETDIKPNSITENYDAKFKESQTSAGKTFGDQVDEASFSKKTPGERDSFLFAQSIQKQGSDKTFPPGLQYKNWNGKYDLLKFDDQENDATTLGKNPSDSKNQSGDKDLLKNPLAEIVVNQPGDVAATTDALPHCAPIGKANSKIKRFRPINATKGQSEIPRIKSVSKTSLASQKVYNFVSKLPIKLNKKEEEKRAHEDVGDVLKTKKEHAKTPGKLNKLKGDQRDHEDAKQAVKEDFGYIVPLYEKELKNISDVWVNTVYCSLTMRTNLVKLLFQAFPNVSRDQFRVEDERILTCLAHVKGSTKAETENLKRLVKGLVANRDKIKEEYSIVSENREIADYYNHDWKKLLKKVTELGEETKKLQMEIPELQKKKEFSEMNANEKIRRMENNLVKKEDEIRKLSNQLNVLKQRESAYKDNTLKIADYQEIKADVYSLLSTQREFEDLKAKYSYQNITSEKKIRDLEYLLEEKKKILEREREFRKKLQNLLYQLRAHQKRLTTTVGSEQVDYILGRTFQERGKRREQLWIAAVKLVLKGFIIQMKKLERDRNKMLLDLQTNELVNSADFAAFIKKDNFIKSIQQQMNELQKMCTSSSVTTTSQGCK